MQSLENDIYQNNELISCPDINNVVHEVANYVT